MLDSIVGMRLDVSFSRRPGLSVPQRPVRHLLGERLQRHRQEDRRPARVGVRETLVGMTSIGAKSANEQRSPTMHAVHTTPGSRTAAIESASVAVPTSSSTLSAPSCQVRRTAFANAPSSRKKWSAPPPHTDASPVRWREVAATCAPSVRAMAGAARPIEVVPPRISSRMSGAGPLKSSFLFRPLQRPRSSKS
jgi:hypothetical protein